MKISITGLNGYLGSLIAAALKDKGHDVNGINRALLYAPPALLASALDKSEVVINLAGATVLQRWTKANKDEIYNSRVVTSKNLVAAINLLEEKDRPLLIISASAIGIYRAGAIHDESSMDFDAGFLGKVVLDWEKTLNELPDNIKTTIFRIGPVLGRKSKTITNLKLPFQLGLGGRIASGRQAFPFIHEKDLVKAFVWAIETSQDGIFNLVAPEHISNIDFTKNLAHLLHRPAILPVPAFALRLIYGEAASMLSESPLVLPKALIENGFQFYFPDIYSSLQDILA